MERKYKNGKDKNTHGRLCVMDINGDDDDNIDSVSNNTDDNDGDEYGMRIVLASVTHNRMGCSRSS